MPILSYFAVVGSVLVALLFVADATMEKSGPLPFNNEAMGLPKPWHPENSRQPDTRTTVLTTAAAPAPDMNSEAVRAAAPPAPQIAQAAQHPAHDARAEAVADPAKPDAAKKKRVARKPPRDGDWRSYAWTARDNGGFFGGNSTFGRF